LEEFKGGGNARQSWHTEHTRRFIDRYEVVVLKDNSKLVFNGALQGFNGVRVEVKSVEHVGKNRLTLTQA
jgi:hypothetical protein